jgi:hypothetical protein
MTDIQDFFNKNAIELLIHNILRAFYKQEVFELSEEQEKVVINKSLILLDSLDAELSREFKIYTMSKADSDELDLLMEKLSKVILNLFTMCVIFAAREEKYKEIMDNI